MNYEEIKNNEQAQKIINYHARKIDSLVDREELESEKDSALFRAMNTFDPEKTQFNTWLNNCCHFYFLERFRQLTNTKVFYPIFNEPKSNDNTKLNKVISLLSDFHLNILTSRYVDKLSPKEIREKFNLTRDSYCYHLKSAKSIFKELYLGL